MEIDHIARGVYEVYSKYNDGKDTVSVVKGMNAAFDLKKSRNVEAFLTFCEGLKTLTELSPLGKALMYAYAGPMELFKAMATASDNADKAAKDVMELADKLMGIKRSGLLEATAFDARALQLNPYSYLSHLCLQNPGTKINDPELIQTVVNTTKAAKKIIHVLDKTLIAYFPLCANYEELSNAAASDLENMNNMFGAANKEAIQLDLLAVRQEVSHYLSSLLSNRNDWARWIFKKQHWYQDYINKAAQQNS